MRTIAFIGAGSAKFVRGAIADLLSYPELHDSRLRLMDIDPIRLDRAARLARKMVTDCKAPMTVEATTDRRRALDGAYYVIVTLMVGGMRQYASDGEIPARHGVFQAVGDTSGPGAIFRLVRTAPVLEGIVNDLRSLAPHAWVLNYANPMAMLTGALVAFGHRRSVGLCHSVYSCINTIGAWLGIPPYEIDYTAAGLNHINFYLTLRHKGHDLYPELRAQASRIIREAETWEADAWRTVARGYERVRFELLTHLGYFPAEGPWHQTDFYGWFRKTRKHIKEHNIPTGWAFDFDRRLGERAGDEVEQLIDGTVPISYNRSQEFAVRAIHALETGISAKIYGNVPNDGCISNLPADTVVEVPCWVDRHGIQPCHVGALPPQLAAVMQPHAAVYDLALRGVLCKDRALIRQAIMLDPLTQAALSLSQIDRMVDELFADNAAYAQYLTTCYTVE